MLINAIGVEDEGDDVVELDRFRAAPDPKSRQSMTTILADALASTGGPDGPDVVADAPVVALPVESLASAETADGVGHAA